VRKTKEQKAGTASYNGGRMPLSGYLSELMRQQLHRSEAMEASWQEYAMLAPLLRLQRSRSAIPGPDQLLVEITKSADGLHVFCYPFEGRLVHEVMGGLAASRLSLLTPVSISIAMNDYGFEMLCNKQIDIDPNLIKKLLNPHQMEQDVFNSVNAMEMARRKFRDISVISGMVFQGYPGKIKKNRHLQSSSQLMFDVLTQYEPDHQLLKQSYEETIHDQLDQARLRRALIRIQKGTVLIRETERFTPFAFPLVVDNLRGGKISSEKLSDRIQRMLDENR
jgi:ATP-dependent Lhr-like helicase